MSANARHVFLIGFMATGKSTVGELLGEQLARPFLDLDEEIERRAGMAVAEIFASEGEDGFRQREADALAAAIEQPAAVIATGGGAAGYGDNLSRMRASGLVVTLTAPIEVLQERVDAGGEATRPLFHSAPEKVAALLHERMPIYRQGHACVATEDATPAQLARRMALLVADMEALPGDALERAAVVALERASYPVIVRRGVLADIGSWIERRFGARPPTRLAIISDSNVAPLYADTVSKSLAAAGFTCSTHVVPAGEGSKRVAELSRLLEEMAVAELDRRSAVIALGGGVVGDLAGFAAACLYRGVACVQVPTTILAMVDSAIGGKTGVDLEAGKNLAGAFWQPHLVVADPEVLMTLPARERRAAFGEIVKYGLLDGESLYRQVEALAPLVTAPELSAEALAPLADIILRCASIKSFIVTRDEREQTGERALLNLGHTVGHALEAAAGYDGLLHGEAVGVGLLATCRVSAALGLCEPALEVRVAETLRRAGLAADLDEQLSAHPEGPERVLSFIGRDKKRSGHKIGFVAVRAVGDCRVVPIELNELVRILRP